MLKIGWATREITPERPAMVMGQMHRRVASEAIDPLTLTALALEGGEPRDCAIIVSCDMCMATERLHREVRARLQARLPEVPSEKIFLCATHTHASLVLEGEFYGESEEVMSPAECSEWVTERVLEAAVEAWERRTPQGLARGFGHAVVGHNRRAVYSDGSARMYGDTKREDFVWIEGYEDHSVDMVFTWEGGTLTGMILAIPCPSQVDEHKSQWSADYWHDVRVALRARYGEDLFVLPLCGAAGDQSPHFLLYAKQEEEMRKRRGVSERQEIAERVAIAVERALEGAEPVTEEIPFAHEVRHLVLTPRQVSREERDWAEAECVRAKASMDPESWWPQRLQQVVAMYEAGNVAEPVPTEVHVLRLGDLALATNPFELFLDYGLRIKACSPAAQTLVVQLAAGCGWYLPTARAVAGGGYGTMPAVSVVGPEGGDELVKETLQTIRELW